MNKKIYVFAGPTLFGTDIEVGRSEDIVWLPPIRRGGVDELLSSVRVPASIAVVDGTFHSYPSVSHIELRDALDTGWRVYGLSSMGAIRACEMRHLGMKPWGRVAQIYCDDPEFADDEVTLVHSVEPPYVPMTEPLVHIRAFCARALEDGLLSECQTKEIIDVLRERWYGHRTLELLRTQIGKVSSSHKLGKLEGLLQNFLPYRIKQQDLVSFVQQRPWISEA